jgi:hypothetical protein
LIKEASPDWKDEGGSELPEITTDEDHQELFIQKWYIFFFF